MEALSISRGREANLRGEQLLPFVAPSVGAAGISYCQKEARDKTEENMLSLRMILGRSAGGSGLRKSDVLSNFRSAKGKKEATKSKRSFPALYCSFWDGPFRCFAGMMRISAGRWATGDPDLFFA